MRSPPLALGVLLALLYTSALAQVHLPMHRRRRSTDLSPEERLQQLVKAQMGTRAKYGIESEGEVQQRSVREKRQSRSASVRLAGNQGSYYTSITLGTPPQTHEVLMDTGSADLVVLSTLTSVPSPPGATSDACSTDCVITAPLYDPSTSSSAQVTSKPVDITYGTGSAEGVLVSDRMGFGGWEANQSFIASPPSLVSDLVSSSDQTGLLGLAWQGLAESGAMPFVQGLFEARQLEEPVMAFGLAPLDARSVLDPNEVVPGGVLSLGTTLPSLYTGSLDYVPLSSSTGVELYWSIPLEEVRVGGIGSGLSASAVMIDTGTNSIAIPQTAAEAIYAEIPGAAPLSGSQGVWSYPCSTDVSLTFIFGSTAYTLPSQSFNAGLVSSDRRMCAGAVSSLGTSRRGRDVWIMGTPFLFSFYSSFRFSPPSVGFAALNNSASLLDPGPIPTSSGGEATVSVSGLGGAEATRRREGKKPVRQEAVRSNGGWRSCLGWRSLRSFKKECGDASAEPRCGYACSRRARQIMVIHE